jgi:predicted alpha/beta hydrolase family esterase
MVISKNMQMQWREIAGNWVYLPPRPQAIVHFLGGAFVATAPQVTYRFLLEDLAQQGYGIIATPFFNTFNHHEIVDQVYQNLERVLERLSLRSLPIYGVGHSMGCKIHLLLCSHYDVQRAGNIFVSFNNFSAKDSVPLLNQMPSELSVEFTPSPQQTLDLVDRYYNVRRNLIVKFRDDNIDQSYTLERLLQPLFPGMVTLQNLRGNHLTPLGQNVQWQTGELFTPLDAIGQWFKQEVYKDLHQLQREMNRWLNPRLT